MQIICFAKHNEKDFFLFYPVPSAKNYLVYDPSKIYFFLFWNWLSFAGIDHPNQPCTTKQKLDLHQEGTNWVNNQTTLGFFFNSLAQYFKREKRRGEKERDSEFTL